MSAVTSAAENGSNTEAPPDDWDADSSDGSDILNGKATNDDDDDDDEDETNEDAESTATSDDDDDNIDDHILQRYHKLSSRRVDLVGDYAGDELFVIEGDSMLLRSFSDAKLDFSPGLQMLHATYNVEHFLHNLVKRKCNFDIVFFESNKDLCVPPNASPEDAVKYLLARAAIIRHLETNLPHVRQDIAVKTFASYVSDDFAKYLSVTAPYFVMLHDGAQAAARRGKHMKQTAVDSIPVKGRLGLRRMILQFIGRGYNVALVNGLEWRDTKVMTMVLESRRTAMPGKRIMEPVFTQDDRKAVNTSTDLSKLRALDAKLTDRQQLAILAVSRLLKDPPAAMISNALPRLCCAFLLHQALIAHIPLSRRRVQSTPGAKGAQDLLRELAGCSEAMIRGTAELGLSESTTDIADYIDGRLYLQLTEAPESPTGETQAIFETLLGAVEHLGSQGLPTGETSVWPTPRQHAAGQNGQSHIELAVLPFSNPVFDKHLEPVRLKTDEAVAYDQSSQSHRIFQELTHWHNAKKPIIMKAPPT
ncbi:hypothetical protein B0A55_13196, partial [Friedmanniomyces simplex]